MRKRTRATPNPAIPWALLAVLAVIVFVVTVRLRVAEVPLERDEGEYAYAGQLILEGVPPYSIAYNMKFPGTYYAYAVILALLGHTPAGIHLGLMLVNVVTILLVFGVGRRLLGEFAGAISAVSFAILSVDRWIFGVFAHATHFVILAAMAGLLLLLGAIKDDRRSTFLWAGVLLGISVLMKQHAIVFLPFAACVVVWGGSPGDGRLTLGNAKRVGAIALGTLVPFAVVLAVLVAQRVLGRFWFWTFRYASAYVSELSFSEGWSRLGENFRYVGTVNAGFWILGGIGLAALWLATWKRQAKVVLTGLLVASLLATCPGFYFREHYFILVLPAVALLVGVAMGTLRQLLERSLSRRVATASAVVVLLGVVGFYVTKERNYLFSMGARALSQTTFGTNPFIEAMEIGRYIRDRTDKNDRIAVLGSEPEIYFYADRKAATGYIYTYALMEPQPYAKSMQAEMIREIEAARPKFVVFSRIDVSWLAQRESDQGIVRWGARYLRDCYDPVGIADVVTDNERHIAWDAKALQYVARSADLVLIYRRKSDGPCTAGP